MCFKCNKYDRLFLMHIWLLIREVLRSSYVKPLWANVTYLWNPYVVPRHQSPKWYYWQKCLRDDFYCSLSRSWMVLFVCLLWLEAHLLTFTTMLYFLPILMKSFKQAIVQRGAVRPLIEMLRSPNLEARELSASALWRLARVILLYYSTAH